MKISLQICELQAIKSYQSDFMTVGLSVFQKLTLTVC